jgi:acetolactate synthase-1/2/3 large subunit
MLRDARVTARGGARPRIGADALCEAILLQGSDTIWGYPGGVILPLYDVLVDHPELRHILDRHEQAASHAADGYARASGKEGVELRLLSIYSVH